MHKGSNHEQSLATVMVPINSVMLDKDLTLTKTFNLPELTGKSTITLQLILRVRTFVTISMWHPDAIEFKVIFLLLSINIADKTIILIVVVDHLCSTKCFWSCLVLHKDSFLFLIHLTINFMSSFFFSLKVLEGGRIPNLLGGSRRSCCFQPRKFVQALFQRRGLTRPHHQHRSVRCWEVSVLLWSHEPGWRARRGKTEARRREETSDEGRAFWSWFCCFSIFLFVCG